MIASWMIYSLAVGLLLALAALALEPALQARGRPARGVWAAALLLSLLLPAAASFLPRPLPQPPPGAELPPPAWIGAATPAEADAPASPPAPAPGSALLGPSPAPPRALDPLLARAWLLSSLLLLAGTVLGYSLLLHRRRAWRATAVDGVPVLVSGDTGPAVVGFLRNRIVLPEWAVRAEPARRTLILEHEREHVRARDPLLLLLGVAALVAMPWNATLWWQLRRLRLALEIDCDARVLSRHPDRLAYGTLLVEMGRSRSAGPLPLAAFSETRTFLERRIRAMTRPRGSSRSRLVVGLAAAGIAAVIVAALPLPPSLRPAAAGAALQEGPPRPAVEIPRALLPARAPSATPAHPDTAQLRTASAQARDTVRARFDPAELRALVEREYPPALRAAEAGGYATVRFTVDAEGRAREVETVVADRAELGEAARRVAEQLRFVPARLEGRAVPERVERFAIHFRPGPAPEERPDPRGIDPVLRAAIERHHPELLRGEPARLPYLFFVVDTLGQRVLSEVGWEPPTTADVGEALRRRFPRLRGETLGPTGRRSVRLGPERRPVEVFWAEVHPPADETDVVKRGPYPLGALVREHSIPYRLMLAAVQSRHPEIHERGLPENRAVWVVGTRTGEIRASGVASSREISAAKAGHLAPGESKGEVVGFARARDGSTYRVYWSIVETAKAPR